MLIRLLLLAIAGYLVFRWIRGASRPSIDKKAEKLPETMVKCAHCAVHLPQSRAIAGDDQLWFCTPEHRQLHQPPPR
jgi:uncharacterized protein